MTTHTPKAGQRWRWKWFTRRLHSTHEGGIVDRWLQTPVQENVAEYVLGRYRAERIEIATEEGEETCQEN